MKWKTRDLTNEKNLNANLLYYPYFLICMLVFHAPVKIFLTKLCSQPLILLGSRKLTNINKSTVFRKY